jgi:ribosome biogenesis GTPase / thiamine phosphate phosphatase
VCLRAELYRKRTLPQVTLLTKFKSCRARWQSAEAAGKLREAADQGGDWPAVGDWVAVEGDARNGLLIREVLPRRTRIARKMAGKKIAEQVLAVNVDTIFVVMALDGDFNARRLERYLAQIWDCGAKPVIVLNKSDLCESIEGRIREVERSALGVPAHTISATTGKGIDELLHHLRPQETVVLLGSSGVGKSYLVNRLLGTVQQAVYAVREQDSRGRHTTTGRQLFFLPNGAMIIDTPGLRELQLWDADEGVNRAFHELEEISSRCRFRDCTHASEPGCAVSAAIADGSLDSARFESYRKLQREQAFLRRKVDAGAQQEVKKHIKTINRAVRQMYRQRDEKGKA